LDFFAGGIMKKPLSKQEIAKNFIKKNPNRTFPDFVKMTGNPEKINAKDFSNGKERLKKEQRRLKKEQGRKNLKAEMLKEFKKETSDSLKTKILKEFLENNPGKSYGEYKRAVKNYTTTGHFYYWKKKIEGGGEKKHLFKKQLVSVIDQLEIPDKLESRDAILKWLNESILSVINKAQSAFRIEAIGTFFPESKVELRMNTTNKGR
jgi:hypothetical protein